MTPEESRRLAIAQRIWHEAQPSEDDVERAVRRMQFRSARPARRARLRVGPAFALAVALIAVLAYAAPGPRAQITDGARRALARFGYGAQPVEPPVTEHQGSSSGAALSVPASPTGGEKSRAAEAPTEPTAPADKVEAPAAKAPDRVALGSVDAKQRGATWQDVNRALAAGNDQSAATSLRELERTAVDRATRAKARLGLAQLAVGRGDCQTARRLARSVATTPNLDEKIVQRAHTVMLRCELR